MAGRTRGVLAVVVIATAVLLSVWFFTPPPPSAIDPPASTGTAPVAAVQPPAVPQGPRSGLVVRALDHSPVAGAEVFAFPAPSGSRVVCPICRRGVRWCREPDSVRQVLEQLRAGRLTSVAFATTVTADDGSFVLPELPAGVEVVARTAEGFTLPDPGPSGELLLEVQKAPSVRVLDQAGEPLVGVPVMLFRDADSHHRTITSDAAGRVELGPLDFGAWLGTDAEGFVPAALTLFEEEAQVLTLSRPRAVHVRTQRDGQPFDAEVTFVRLHHEHHLRTRAGELLIEGLGADELELWASTPDLNSVRTSLKPSLPVTEVLLSLESNAVLVLTVEGSRDRLFNSVRLVPRTPGGKIVLAHVRVGTTTLGPVEPGEWELELSSSGQPVLQRSLELVAGRNELTLALAGGIEVRGVVVDDLDHPLPQMIVSLKGKAAGGQISGEDGAFAFSLEKPGRVTLVAHTLDQLSTSLEVEAPDTHVRLVMPREAKLTIEARAPDRKPVSGFVSVTQGENLKAGLTFKREVVSNPVALMPGKYEVDAHFDGYPEQKLGLELSPAETRRLVVDLAAGAQLAGRVISRSGSAVPGVSVFAQCGQDANASADADREGRFTLGGLVRGPCSIMVGPRNAEEPEWFEVTAPATDLVLKLNVTGRSIAGRVVNEKGAPLDRLRIEGQFVPTEEGRFALFTEADSLGFEVPGYARKTVSVGREELGDVVLQALTNCSGVVLSAQLEPVPGAELTLEWMERRSRELPPSDADGTFTAALYDERPRTIYAHIPGNSGVGSCSPGASARIVLSSDVPVTGTVFAAPGRIGLGRVLATSVSTSSPRVTSTDSNGRFRFALAEGVWAFQSGPVTRTWLVQAPAFALALGAAPDACTLTLRSASPFAAFWLLRPPAALDEFVVTPGSAMVQLPAPVLAATVTGLPCGALQLVTLDGQRAVVLTPPVTEVNL